MNIKSRVCPICKASNLEYQFSVLSNADGSISGYEIIQCKSCTAGLTNPLPTSEDLSKYYSTGIYAKGGGRLRQIVDIVLSKLYDYRLSEICRYKKSTGVKLLDIGCGKGRFIAHAVKKSWQAEGVDSVSAQVSAAQERYQNKISFGEVWEIEYPENHFDVVTAWHVLEHLTEPHRVINEVARILCSGGVFVCEVPYFNSWQASIGGGNWFQLDAPRHLIHYTIPALKNLLNQHQLKVVHISTFSLELGYFSMLQSIENRFRLKPNWLFRWLKRTISSKRKIVLYNIFITLILLLPAFILETIAIVFKRGGVLRVVAIKE